jgi:hypothetical protein
MIHVNLCLPIGSNRKHSAPNTSHYCAPNFALSISSCLDNFKFRAFCSHNFDNMLTSVQIKSLLFASLPELQQDAVGHFRHPSILGDDDVPVGLDYVTKDLRTLFVNPRFCCFTPSSSFRGELFKILSRPKLAADNSGLRSSLPTMAHSFGYP